MIPKELKYTKDHEWVKVEGAEALVGITDHAQHELGDITFIELPKAGAEVSQSDRVATVEIVKAASDIYSRLSGKITEVNGALSDAPEAINRSPYADGWIFRLNVKDAGETEKLMDSDAYESYLKELEK